MSYKESEALTTKFKKVDISKAVKDLGHKNIYSLEQGIQLTFEWMKQSHEML